MRKYLLLTALIALITAGTAVQTYSFDTYNDGVQTDVFEDSENITFRLNVSDNQDYNITVLNPSGDSLAIDQPMEQVSSGYYKIYEFNQVLNDPEPGDWSFYVNMTISEEQKLASRAFHVASDTPGIYELERQEFVREGEQGTVTAKITDTGDDLDSVEIQGPDQTYGMSKVEDGSDFDTYRTQVNVDEVDENVFSLNAADSGGRNVQRQFSVYGYRNDEKSTSVDVSVNDSCLVVMENFYAPKNGTLFIGEVGYFTAELANKGSVSANVTVNGLNVTYEGDNRWEEGDPIGPQIQSFGSQNYTGVMEGEQAIYNRQFTNSTTAGWYTGRTSYSADCYFNGDEHSISAEKEVVFSVVNASGGVSRSGNESTNQTIASNASTVSDKSTNLTYPSNVSDVSTEDTNQTLEREANQTGETGQNVEGDNAQPGVTPEPEPEPEPEPTPMLSLDMESVKSSYRTARGGTIRANISLTNEGNEPLSDLTVSPQIQKFREDWQASDAGVAGLDVNQTVYREIIVQPPVSTQPGLYVVPIIGSNPERELDLDYFTVEITEEVENRSNMEIVEAPSSLNVRQNTSTSLPILIRNTGDTPLTNVTGSFQNLDQCGAARVGSIDRIPTNGSASLDVRFDAAETTQSCNTTLILSSEEGSFSFSRVNFTVRPEQGLLPEQYRVPFIATAWTLLLAAFAVMRSRYHPDSVVFKAPFVLIVAGEALIFLYLTADYYQLAQLSFLPF
ncbi:hypothetical protein [Candidatus Nanohalococcus occultus]|uniref:COG1470 family protein n=1 Tax=Candidatus Nanohalococcus occultus TaxID=2978047 RepID=UPI0039E1D91C